MGRWSSRGLTNGLQPIKKRYTTNCNNHRWATIKVFGLECEHYVNIYINTLYYTFVQRDIFAYQLHCYHFNILTIFVSTPINKNEPCIFCCPKISYVDCPSHFWQISTLFPLFCLNTKIRITFFILLKVYVFFLHFHHMMQVDYPNLPFVTSLNYVTKYLRNRQHINSTVRS